MTNEEIIEKLSYLEDDIISTQNDLDEAKQELENTKQELKDTKQELKDTETELEELKVYTENLENVYDKALQELPDVISNINDDFTRLESMIGSLTENIDSRFDIIYDR